MTIQPEFDVRLAGSEIPGRLRVVLIDEPTTRIAGDVIENVVGRCATFSGAVSLQIDDVDGRAAVDLLAELAWAGVIPIAFSLD